MPPSQHPSSSWTLWPSPDVNDGIDGYTPGFLFKVDLPILIGLMALFLLPPVRDWTGVNPWVLLPAFALHFGFAYVVMRTGLYRRNPHATEFVSHFTNLVAAVALPLSTSKSLFILWLLYLLVVWIDAFSNPKAVACLALSLIAPWIDPLWHYLRSDSVSAMFPTAFFTDKAMLATFASALGLVCYLVIAHYAVQARRARQLLAQQERDRATREERTRIGQSLHGTLGAALSEITLWHEIAMAGGGVDLRPAADTDPLADPKIDPQVDPLSRAHARAKSALTELRSLVAGLDSESVSLAGLTVGIRKQTEGLCEAAGVQFNFPEPKESAQSGATESAHGIDMATAYHIAKIAVEGVTNAVRHGRPASVRLTIHLSPLHVEVADDGNGFDPQSTSKGRGLRSLHEHAEALGGTLAIVSSPGAGTTLILRAGPA